MADPVQIEYIDVKLVSNTNGISIQSTSLSAQEVAAVTFMTGSPGAQGVGLPAGGKAGQILVKLSDKDYDFKWVDAPNLSGGTYTLIDSAGKSWILGVNTIGHLTTDDNVTVQFTNTYGGTYGSTVYA